MISRRTFDICFDFETGPNDRLFPTFKPETLPRDATERQLSEGASPRGFVGSYVGLHNSDVRNVEFASLSRNVGGECVRSEEDRITLDLHPVA